MRGVIKTMNEAQRNAEIKANGKIYLLHYELLGQGEIGNLFEGLELSFEANKENVVTSFSLNSKQERPEYLKFLEITKDVRTCVSDYFSPFEHLLANYRNVAEDMPQENFLRMRRFLMTAYNDIRDIDMHIIDKDLSSLKSELDKLARYYSEFRQQSGYTVRYAYEKIFLTQQAKYNQLNDTITRTQHLITRAALQEKPLALQIQSREKELAKYTDTSGKAYRLFEKNLKAMRKRYADLVYFIGKKRGDLEKLLRIRVIFIERYFATFRVEYEPLVKDFHHKLLFILNIKAAEFDHKLWTQAKQSRLVRNFFIKAGINGTYSSKTLLKYYLRSIDKEKAKEETLKLFSLLEYIESISTKNVVLIRRTFDIATSNKELLERFDKELKIKIVRDGEELFRLSKAKKDKKPKIDLILAEFEVFGMQFFPFIERFRKELDNANTPTIFCLLTREISPNLMAQAKNCGITHFLNSTCTDEEFIDAMREIL